MNLLRNKRLCEENLNKTRENKDLTLETKHSKVKLALLKYLWKYFKQI
jgi:hypothetical protein